MEISLAAVTDAVEALRAFTGGPVTDLSEDELARAHAAAARVVRLAQVPAAVLATEIARRSDGAGGGMARRRGERNAARLVAKHTGGSTRDAHDQITVGQLLGGGDDAGADFGGNDAPGGPGDGAGGGAPRYPRLAAAVMSGAVSSAKAALVVRTLDDIDGGDDGIEARLVAKAIRLTLDELRKVCVQVVALWNHRRHEEREKAMRGQRYLTLTEQADGMVTLSGRLDPASAAPIAAWLDAQVRAGFAARRDAGLGRAEPGEAGRMRVDALVDLARHGMRCDRPGSGVSTTVVVRIGLKDLTTGVGIGSCDAISTPLTVSQVRAMAVDSGWLPVVLGGASQPLDVGRARRFFTPAQRVALAERDGGCAFCHAPVAWCDAHHIRPWSAGGRSDLANGVLLCTRCHHRIHDDGWTVHATDTAVWFTPPATVDPDRVPRHGGKAALHVDLATAPRTAPTSGGTPTPAATTGANPTHAPPR
ncbi:HNH endonuclease [Demequina lignilytica]|uniref:DUF222 domain-containing protein n=1 Tax=Demequina lignilytica TaxID=3051663 RepID=A0AB35ML56_9MICO|nr:HNH endonuclease signature motif containing protein [Demequina sp. SYSU T0a273]MDN4484483.1 DUF222 domain-containing protein [Demequina sp. SYSU T0a273]